MRKLPAVFLQVAILFGANVYAQSRAVFPEPTGTLAVGRAQFDWTDKSRPDAENPSGYREIVVWVWHPASPKAGAETAEQLPGKWGDLLWAEFTKHQPAATSGRVFSRTHTHSYPDARVASGRHRYPVLLFEPGNGFNPLLYSNLIEDIVSRGYVVAGIVPTYYSGVSVFSDGRVAASHLAAAPPPQTRDYFPVWVADMRFTLDQLQKLNQDGRSDFRHRLYLQRIGAFGHSLGGAASLQAAKDDARIKAAINIDGGLWGDVASAGLSKPFLVFRTDSGGEMNLDVLLRRGNPGYLLTLAGATHMFSSDLWLLPLVRSTMKDQMGSIDPVRALAITKAYVAAFFGEYLEGKKSPLLAGPSSDYPEVRFEMELGDTLSRQ